jgi:hypothetical protein
MRFWKTCQNRQNELSYVTNPLHMTGLIFISNIAGDAVEQRESRFHQYSDGNSGWQAYRKRCFWL